MTTLPRPGPVLAYHPVVSPQPTGLVAPDPCAAMEALSTPRCARLNRRILVHLEPMLGSLLPLLRRLRRMGHTVTITRSTNELRAQCDRAETDLVLLPFDTASAASSEILPWLAAEHHTVSVLLLSSAPTTLQVTYALDLGVVGFLPEHSDMKALHSLLERAWHERDLRLSGWLATHEAERKAQLRERSRALLDGALQTLDIAWQPLEDACTGRRLSWEALVRAPALGDDSAGPLLETARELGRTAEVDALVQQQVSETLLQHPEWTQVFVNCELESVRDGSLGWVHGPLVSAAERVIFDLPDLHLVQDYDIIAQRIVALRALGYRVAANDFDLWAASTGSAPRLAPDFVKLAMTDLRQCRGHNGRLDYVRFLIDAAKARGIEFVVVGVATPADRALALEFDVDLLQGDLIAPAHIIDPPMLAVAAAG